MNLDTDVAYAPADLAAARKLVERLDLLHADRVTMAAAGDQPAAVRDSILIHDQVDGATVPQLRAAVILLTTPELRPAIPVVVGPTSAPAGPDIQPSEKGAGGLAAPAPPALRTVLGLVGVYGDTRAAHARHNVERSTVVKAYRDVETAVEQLALGSLAAEVLRAHRDGAL